MARAGPEVADIFRRYGAAYRETHGGSLCTAQRRVMSAIELCRTAALGGHIERCDRCDHQRICYNSCRDRHCPKCQSLARAQWLEDRQSELLDTHLCSVATYVLASGGCAVGGPRTRLEEHITNHYRDLRKPISPGSSRQCLVRLDCLTSQ